MLLFKHTTKSLAAKVSLAAPIRAPALLLPRSLSSAAAPHFSPQHPRQQFDDAQQQASPSTRRAAADPSSRPRRTIVSVSAAPSGVKVSWSDGEQSTFHYEWLHRNRPETKLACGQNTQPPVRPTPPDTRTHSAATLAPGGGGVTLRWGGGGGDVSVFQEEWLRQYAYSRSFEQQRGEERRPTAVAQTQVPSVRYEDVMRDDAGVLEWLDAVNRAGLCVVRGCPQEEGHVMKVAGRIGTPMPTIYGDSWDVRTEAQPINCAYTSHALDLHQDLAYYESPPCVQLLHCVRFDEGIRGGESTFADAIRIAEILRERDPAAFATLARVPATFQKIHYDRPDPVHLEYRRPHIEANNRGDVVNVFWAPAFEGPLEAPEEDVEEYYRAYRLFAGIAEEDSVRVAFRLQPGDLISFNNRRMLHGRNGFSEGAGAVRHLQGCYVSAETFINRLRVLQNKQGDGPRMLSGVQVARCGNGDFS